jgi:hypothetical protein
MIQNSSVLVDLNLGVWTGRKMDKKVSAQIDQDNNTKAKAGNYHKKLMAGTAALDNLHNVVGRIRFWHYGNTLPWSDNGQRLLPMVNFFNYKQKMNEFKDEFVDAAEKFYTEYPNLVAVAAFTLTNLFDATDYPTVDKLRSKNYFRVMFSPVPDSGDFRVGIPEEYRRELEQISKDREQAAMQDLWDRLHTVLNHMSEKLAGQNKQIFRDTLLDNAVELCAMLTVLNVTNDAKLEQARQELEKTLVGLDAKDLRKNDSLRLDTKARVDEILSMF